MTMRQEKNILEPETQRCSENHLLEERDQIKLTPSLKKKLEGEVTC